MLAAFPRTAAERKVRRCARKGVWANFVANPVPDNPEDEQLDATAPARCGNVVRADFLQALLAAGGDEVGSGGLLVRGAIITGTLDLKGLQGLPQLALRRCRLEETPIFEQAELGRLELSWCALPGLRADQLSARHGLVLTRSRISGPARLVEAKIDGPLRLADAELGEPVKGATGTTEPRSPVALDAVAIRVDNLVGLDGLTAWGAVRLTGVRVGGTLSLRHASLHFGGGVAVAADRIDVKGNLRLDHSTVEGSVSLRNATIGGGLFCAGTRLYDPPLAGRHRPWREPPDALHEAKILVADQAQIGGDVWLSGSRSDDELPAVFASRGCVSFLGATVNGSMVIDAASLAAADPKDESRRRIAFDAEGLRVESRLTWRCNPPEGYVDFRYANVHRLDDRLSAWPGDKQRGKSYLTGLVYEELLGGFSTQEDLKNRIDWLKRQPRYTSQPYEQLARFYRNSGHLRHASDVGVEREKERLRNMTGKDLKTRFSRGLGRLYGLVAGFGYRPQRALTCLFVLFALTLVPLMWAESKEHISPSKASEDVDVVRVQLDRHVAETSAGQAARLAPLEDACDASYPCYSTLLYSLETVIPLINLRQAEYWSVQSDDWPTRTLRGWLGISSILGWVLVTLVASTMLTARR